MKKKRESNQKPSRDFTWLSEWFGFPFSKNHSDCFVKSESQGLRIVGSAFKQHDDGEDGEKRNNLRKV